MAVFYLRHPIHGAKVATSNLEVAHDEEHGWEQFVPGEVTEEPTNAIVSRRGRRQKVDDDNVYGIRPDLRSPETDRDAG